MSWSKKLVFGAVTCIGFFVVVEFGLWLAGIQPVLYPRDPYVGFSSQLPLFVKDAKDPLGMVTAANKQRIFNFQRFQNPKPPNTYRIFCMGGSTTYGHPYDDKTSFCGWLRAMLPKADPSRRWELINCGGISYASYREALLMEELIHYQPDLFIIYSAHNEFLEQRTYSEIIAMPRVVRGLGAALRKTRFFAALKGVSESATRHDHQRTQKDLLPAEVETRLDRVVGPQAYHRDDVLEKTIIDHFRFNTARVVQIARSRGAEVIFVTPASNLRDCAPFKSENKKGLSDEEYRRWQSLYRSAAASRAGGQLEQALRTVEQAILLDDGYAHLHYLRGRLLWQLKRFDEAKAAYVRARDEDVCPLRALTSMIEIVREMAAQQRVPIVDYVNLLDGLAEHATPGDDWFLDHVHPTIEGNRRLALALLSTLMERRIVHAATLWNETVVDQVRESVESQIDKRANGLALCTAAKVIAWAGKHEEAFRLSVKALELAPSESAVLFEAGKNAGQIGRTDEAIRYLKKSIELNSNFVEAYGLLGNALAAKGEAEEAVRQYRTALRIKPEHAEMHSNLAALLSKQGDLDGSIEQNKEALRISPAYAEAHNNLAWTLKEKGQLSEALTHFREALRLKPGLPAAMMGLAWLLAATPDPRQRDPSQAVPLGERLVDLSHSENWMSLDTLGVAYASAGRYQDAVRVGRKAVDLAQRDSPKDAPAVAERLKLYERNLPYRERGN